MKLNIRNSNFELLRLICMFYIIIHHFLVHGMKNVAYFDADKISVIALFLNSFLVIAVNCFILISGFFGIKFTTKGLLNLVLMVFFYTLSLTILNFIYHNTFSLKELISSFLIFSHSKYWFIKAYFYLYLFSPILNKVIDNSTKKEHHLYLLILSIITFYFGFLWKDSINDNGYNVNNFIFLYFIGRYIFKHMSLDFNRNYAVKTYIISSSLIFLFVLIIYLLPETYNQIIPQWGFAYNNPLVIISSISFFLIFRSINLKSQLINKFAQSTFAIYLIHENIYLRDFLYRFINSLNTVYIKNELLTYIVLPFIALLIMILCISIDQIRLIITEPLLNLLMNIEQKYRKIFIAKTSFKSNN